MLLAPMTVVFCFAVAMRLPIWPRPFAALDVDRTILLHQAEASIKKSGAEILLIGDSSCLMGVSARRLGEALGRPVLNLATLSDVPLEMHGRLARNYCEANPGRVKALLVLMHSQTLRLGTRAEYFAQAIDAHLGGREQDRAGTPRMARWLGGESFRARILTRMLPVPLPGRYGEYYGFNTGLWRYMDEHGGSAIDPHRLGKIEGSPEVRIAPGWEEASERFKAATPKAVRILAGIAPSPASFAAPNHAAACQEVLEQWARWLGAEAMSGLPLTLPDEHFASATHLNEAGVKEYTERLGAALSMMLREARE